MTPTELENLVLRFEALSFPRQKIQFNDMHSYAGIIKFPETSSFRRWSTQAGSVLAEVFHEHHPVRRAWDLVDQDAEYPGIIHSLDTLEGIFRGATELVRQGHIGTFAATVQAETLSELLDQADDLASQGHVAASAVVAGGALETHLRHLVDRHGIAFVGDGSMEKYNTAIAQARNAGTVVYSATDGKLVTAWGGIRNEAAHKPMDFKRPVDGVSAMILGIREFLARVP